MEVDEIYLVGSECKDKRTPYLIESRRISIGTIGGKHILKNGVNEDGCLAFSTENWECAFILDGHTSPESMEACIDLLRENSSLYLSALEQQDLILFKEKLLNLIFHNLSSKDRLTTVNGETSLLCVARSQDFICWLNIGDNHFYLLNKEFEKNLSGKILDQYLVNQRHFYEWIGESGSHNLKYPCYTSGIKELRGGNTSIVLITDGFLENEKTTFSSPRSVYESYIDSNHHQRTREILLNHADIVKDSASIISWSVNIKKQGIMPSKIKKNSHN